MQVLQQSGVLVSHQLNIILLRANGSSEVNVTSIIVNSGQFTFTVPFPEINHIRIPLSLSQSGMFDTTHQIKMTQILLTKMPFHKAQNSIT